MNTIREANRADNQALLELTALTPMEGRISLRIDRFPDFFSLLGLRGESKVLVAEKNRRIIAAIAASCQEVYVNNKEETVHYIADLRVHPEYHRKGIGARLAIEILHRIRKEGHDLVFCTAAEGNDQISSFFQGRLLPKGFFTGKFLVYQIIPTRFGKKRFSGEIRRHLPGANTFSEYYNRFTRRYQLGLVYREADFSRTTNLVAIKKGRAVASISLLDTSDLKQNVVISMPLYLKALIFTSHFFSKFLPVLHLPKPGEPIRMLYIRAFAYEDGNEDALMELIREARKMAFREKYTFLSIGLHERDPLIPYLKKIPKITFVSNGILGSLQGNEGRIEGMMDGVFFEDYSLV